MKYPKVTVLSLPDNSFSICVPLIDKEMERFGKRLSALFRQRGEKVQKSRENGISFFTTFTVLSKKEIEEISNKILRKILKTLRKRG